MHIQPFVLYRTPESFHKDVVQSPAFSIHADTALPLLQRCQKIMAGKLAALVCIEYLRLSLLQGTIQRMNAEVCIQCVRQLQADHVTAIPVNDGNQIHKPLRHRTVRDVRLDSSKKRRLICCYPAQNKARAEKTEPCISKPEKEALPEPNCEMGVFLFSGDKYINGQ